ncbi:MAG: hypothetical protein R3D33_08745 [Hyphomicrobiaceae bacterium]
MFRLLKGSFTAKTLARVEEVLGLGGEPVSQPAAPSVEVADIRYGGYHRQIYAYYEGAYTCLRPSFTDAATLSAYPLTIRWSGRRGLSSSRTAIRAMSREA